MRLLIDTHAPLWFCEGNPALSPSARAAMEDAGNERFVSHTTAWEVAIKMGLKKLTLQVEYGLLFSQLLKANGWEILPPALDHYQALIALPRYHGDPFDRLLIAQAQVEGLTLVSCDAHFPAYGIPLLW